MTERLPPLGLPQCNANPPDCFQRRIGTFRFDYLLYREELVIEIYGLTPGSLYARPGLPIVPNVAVDFGSNVGRFVKANRPGRFLPGLVYDDFGAWARGL